MAGSGQLLIASFVPGWDPFVKVIESGLNFLANLTGSAGLAIIIFTILIKLLLTPLTVKSLRSSRAMQDLQPKIKALQKRYGNDRQKVSAETMRLYQEHKVNPMAGCFPMLLQIPVFIGLYQSISHLSTQGVGEFAHSFLWLHSLALPDQLHILPIVAAFFQLIQTRMSMPTGKAKSDDPQQKMMMQMMQFMPFTVIIFGWGFAAGPVIYWATQSVFSAIQQYFITGWGALRDWLPFLPEVIRYTPRTEEELEEDKVIVTGSDTAALPPAGGGLWGLINRQVQKVEEQKRASAAEHAETAAPVKGGSRVIVTSSKKPSARNGSEEADPAEDLPAPRAGRSRIIVTNSTDAGGSVETTPNGEREESRGPVVPRKNRSRR